MNGKTEHRYRKGRPTPVMDMDSKDLPGERWADIPGYEGIYQLSDHGRLKTIDREVTDKNGVVYFRKGYMRTISLAVRSIKGRSVKNFIGVNIILTNDKVKRSYSLARQVYHLFVEPFDIDDQALAVIRKDGDYLNCHYSNLELISVSELVLNDFEFNGRQSGFHTRIRQIHQYGPDGRWLRSYPSVSSAAQETRGNVAAISDAARKEKMLAGNCYWRYGKAKKTIDVSAFAAKRLRYEQSRKRKVQQLTLDGIVLNTFDSISQAAKAIGIHSASSIRNSCNNKKSIGKGFRWKFVDG